MTWNLAERIDANTTSEFAYSGTLADDELVLKEVVTAPQSPTREYVLKLKLDFKFTLRE